MVKSSSRLLAVFVCCVSIGCGEVTPPNRLKVDEAGVNRSTTVEKSKVKDEQAAGAFIDQGSTRHTDDGFTSAQAYPVLFQCNAWPVSNPSVWTYWIHWDALFAARTAVNACWSRTYLPCTYNCFRIR